MNDRREEHAAFLRFLAPSAISAVALGFASLATRLVPAHPGPVATALLLMGMGIVTGSLCCTVTWSGYAHLRRYGLKAAVVMGTGCFGLLAAALMFSSGLCAFVTIP